MSHPKRKDSEEAIESRLSRDTDQKQLAIDAISDMHAIKSTLIDLCSSFASANGIKPDFYFAAGKAMVAAKLVIADEA